MRQSDCARALATLLLLAILAAMPGCSVLKAPQTVVSAVVPGKGSAPPDPLGLQVDIERYADNFVLLTGAALDEYAKREGTESARVEALKHKLLTATAMTGIASGPMPNANLLDLVSVATINRLSLEERWSKATNQTAFEPRVSAGRILETNAWLLAESDLKPEYIKELRKSIDKLWGDNPEVHDTMFFRPQEFAAMVHKHAVVTDVNSVFSLMNLDPTAGLDPAVKEITRTRLMAERAMYTVQRMPHIVRLQTELLTYQLTAQPEVRLAISNTTTLANSADRISRATESVSQTAAELPDRITTERKAIVAALDQQEGKLRDLTATVNQALDSGDKMSTSLNTTIATFTTLMKLFGVGEPSATNAPPDTNSPPFNILDYGQVADHVGAMAKEITTLVGTVNQSVPQVERISQNATVEAQKVVDRSFRLGLVLIAVLLVGAVLAGLAYRFFAEKLKRPAHSSPASTT